MIDAPWVLQLFSFAAFILGALSMGQWMAGCLLVLAKLIIQ